MSLLKVKNQRAVRSLILSSILKVSELFSGFVVGFTVAQSPENFMVAIFLSTALLVLGFYISVRKLIILKPWQYFVVPLSVTIAGKVVFAIATISYLKITT